MITWIPVDKALPKQIKRIDEDGYEYKSSNQLLVWTSDEEKPIAIGCYEDDAWYVDGVGGYTVTHWAFINQPDGRFLQMEYSG